MTDSPAGRLTLADLPLPAGPTAPPTVRPAAPAKQKRRWPTGLQAAALTGYLWLLLVIVCVGAMSWTGLVGFAHDTLKLEDPLAWGVPISLDGAAITLAFFALRSVLSGSAAGLPRLLAVTVVCASAGFNYYHARSTGQGGAAEVFFAGMSILVYVMFEVVLRHLRRQHLAEIGAIEAPLARFRLARWVWFPATTLRTWRTAVDQGLTSPQEALAVARRAKAERRQARLARRAARRGRMDPLPPRESPEPRPPASLPPATDPPLPDGVEGAILPAKSGGAREVTRRLLEAHGPEGVTRALVRKATGVSDSRAGQLLRDEKAKLNGSIP